MCDLEPFSKIQSQIVFDAQAVMFIVSITYIYVEALGVYVLT